MTSVAPSQAFLDGAKDIDQPERYKLIAELVKDRQSVLDVGCGDGLLRRFVHCDGYTGIDIDAVAIDTAQRRHPASRFMRADAETWIRPDFFGAVVLNEFLYYASDPLESLQKWKAFVKPGGLLIVSIYNRPSWLWQNNANMRALRITRRFARQFPQQEHTVTQNGKKWTVLVIHCQ